MPKKKQSIISKWQYATLAVAVFSIIGALSMWAHSRGFASSSASAALPGEFDMVSMHRRAVKVFQPNTGPSITPKVRITSVIQHNRIYSQEYVDKYFAVYEIPNTNGRIWAFYTTNGREPDKSRLSGEIVTINYEVLNAANNSRIYTDSYSFNRTLLFETDDLAPVESLPNAILPPPGRYTPPGTIPVTAFTIIQPVNNMHFVVGFENAKPLALLEAGPVPAGTDRNNLSNVYSWEVKLSKNGQAISNQAVTIQNYLEPFTDSRGLPSTRYSIDKAILHYQNVGLSNGRYDIQVIAKDPRGNKSAPSNYQLLVTSDTLYDVSFNNQRNYVVSAGNTNKIVPFRWSAGNTPAKCELVDATRGGSNFIKEFIRRMGGDANKILGTQNITVGPAAYVKYTPLPNVSLDVSQHGLHLIALACEHNGQILSSTASININR
ncbi:MAG TPA: hypothetical protein VEA59_00825 [Patescibacteria group bacterium]|nr:hypothetical protein [Patescibacteria group bacterium]